MSRDNTKLIADYTRRVELTNRRTTESPLYQRAITDLQLASSALQKVEQDVLDVTAFIATKTDNMNDMAAVRAVWADRSYKERTVAPARRTLQEATSKLKLLETQKPIQPPDYTSGRVRKNLETHLTEYRRVGWSLQQFVNSFADDKASCPTCGTATDAEQFQQRLTDAKKELHRLADVVRQIAHQIEQCDRYDQQLSSWQRDIECLQRDIQLCQQTISQVQLPDAPTISDQAAVQVIAEYVQLQKGLQELKTSMSEHKERLQRATLLHDHRKELMQLLDSELTKIPEITSDRYDTAVRHNEVLQNTAAKRAVLDAKIAAMQDAVVRDEVLLERFRVETTQYWNTRQLADHLAEVRDLFHRERLPRSVVEYQLARMRETINDSLAEFNAPFSVTAIKDLRFEITLANGCVQMADRLSGGQKVLLALAFRMAVNSQFAGELGVLCLDEPTAGLDDTNLDCLYVALDRLREISKSRGLQVVLITHEKGLDTVCDSVVDLTAV